MHLPQPNVVLWVGPKHSGKTTAAGRLIERALAEGLSVAGVLAPAVYQDGNLAGFDVLDVASGRRLPLARRTQERAGDVGPFAFAPSGFELGSAALLSSGALAADLVVVDEVGPLELRGGGWRPAVDRLTADFQGTLLLVVREGLADDVAQCYGSCRPKRVLAARHRAVDTVLQMLHPLSARPGRASR